MRRKTVQVTDSEEESDNESDTSALGTSANKQASPKRKRGRPPGSNNKKPKLQDDSDDDEPTQTNASHTGTNGIISDDSESNSGSDFVPNSATTTQKKVLTKRKRGRPPKTAIPDDSDDDPPTQPRMYRVSSDDDSGSNSDQPSSTSVTNNRKNTPKRGRGRPPRNANRQVLASDSEEDAEPQPSTSQAVNNYEESDSGSETPDSDYGPAPEKRSVKRNTNKTKINAKNAKQQKHHNGVSSLKKGPKNSQLNTSNKRLSQPVSNGVTFDPKLVETLAQKLVYFLLIENQKKYAIRRKAIVANIFKDEVYSPKLYLAVIKKANSILKKTYGMELMELENQKDSYLIVNILSRELEMHDFVEVSRSKQQQHGLILYILTVIFMNENVINEDELIKSLKVLGIDLMSKRLHPIFGDVKKYITTELVKQMYLNYECVSKEPLRYEFTWGLRAKQEFDKRDLLKFACQIMDGTSPEDWRIQHKDAETSA